jgi:hypothetical protein
MDDPLSLSILPNPERDGDNGPGPLILILGVYSMEYALKKLIRKSEGLKK